MTGRNFPWNRLGIDPTSDPGVIRKAYADALRATNVDADIAGYAELRRARDQALWLAAQGDEDDEADDFGLGSFDDDAPEDAFFDDDGADDGGAWDIAPGIQRPLSPAESPAPDPSLSEAQRRAQEAWDALIHVLYPDDGPSDEAVTHAELDEGLAALAILIARAEEADLAEHDALDGALAELFARTWPRSAPFVEPANAAFRWLDEAGALEERPALMFLNQRLKGMRFHEKVQLPGHPLHKAWAELSRPGRAGVLDRLRVKRIEVDKLLAGIRTRYPELESHLDPERVASWDRPGALEGNPGGTGPSIVRWIFIAMLVGSVLARVGGALSESASDGDTPSAQEVSEALVAAQLEIAVAEVFGQGTDMAAVRKADPVFADQLRLVMGQGTDSAEALAFVRLRAQASGAVADYNSLAVRADLRGMWMRAASAQSPELCRNVMVGDFRSLPLPLDDRQRGREQALLRQLLDAKVLNHVPKQGSTRFSIPGWLVEEVQKRSGLTPEQLTKAFTDTASPDRCKAETALIEATLESPGRVPKELLQAL